MGRRLISLMAALAIGTVGAFAFAAPGNASTTVQCNFPKAEVAEFADEAKPAAQADVSEGLAFLRSAKCLDIQYTDKCDGTTVVTMTNWVKDDNDWTVLTVKLDGKEYTLEGGSSPNTETVTVGPKVEDLQAHLVFRGEHNGATWEFTVPFGDPHTWVLPDACPTASPSASASPSPSVSTSTSAPAATTSTPPVAVSHDLPVTGASATLPILGGGLLVLVGVAGAAVMYLRRRRTEEL
jgi:LPXTG-motif cell wall-anchored protein